jgi:hypothetical protein
VSLGVGVILLPMPYIQVSDTVLYYLTSAGFLVTFGLPLIANLRAGK